MLREGWKPEGARRRLQAGGSARSATARPRKAGTRLTTLPTATAAPDAEADIGELNPQTTGRLCNKRVDAEVNFVV